MKKSDYTYIIEGNVVEIIDLNLGNVSVTNDAENVLTEINSQESIEGKFVITYRDSDYRWNQIVPEWRGGKCVSVNFLL